VGSLVELTALERLGGVLARGVRQEDLAWMVEVPVLESALSELGDVDALAAEHQRVFGLAVYATESVFLHPEGLRGGAETARVVERYRDAGFEPPSDPGGLGFEIVLYARLAADDPSLAKRLLTEHLGRWAAPALVAIQRQGSSLYTPVAALAGALLHADLESVAVVLPNFSDPLDHTGSGLRDLADHLMVPVRTGWYLSRLDLQRLSLRSRLPCGFGSRRQMLQALFQTAVQHDEVPRLIEVFVEEARAWDAAYAELGAAAWLGRLRRQTRLWDRLRSASAELAV